MMMAMYMTERCAVVFAGLAANGFVRVAMRCMSNVLQAGGGADQQWKLGQIRCEVKRQGFC